MFTKKKIRKFEEIAKSHNQTIDKMKDGLKEHLGDLYDYSTEMYFNMVFRGYYLSTNFYSYSGRVRDCYREQSLESYTKEAGCKLNAAYQKAVELHEWAKTYVEQCKENKEKLAAFYGQEELPLFIVLESLIPDFRTKYCFCYEFKDTEDDGVYRAYVFPDNMANADIMDIDYRKWSVRPMTKFEFEHIYLMGRLGSKNFDTEEEAIEYDNYLRRLFNGQNRD